MTPPRQRGGDGAVAQVFTALADASRRSVLEGLAARESATATTLAGDLTITRQAVVKHLAVLADAGLVESAREGREVRFRVRATPLRQTASWLAAQADAWDGRLTALKVEAERRAAGAPDVRSAP